MTTTRDLIMRLQAVCFEMSIKGLITEVEFSVIEHITEAMDKNSYALELAVSLTPDDLSNNDLVDCILANEFKTAVQIIE